MSVGESESVGRVWVRVSVSESESECEYMSGITEGECERERVGV